MTGKKKVSHLFSPDAPQSAEKIGSPPSCAV